MKVSNKIIQINEDIKLDIETIVYKTLDNVVRKLGYGIIVESGSNANGSYVKWGDGTMSCTREVTIDLNVEDPQPFTFPAVFTSVDFVGKQFHDGTVTLVLTNRYNNVIVYVSGSNWALRTRSPHESPSNLTLKLFAIGRWK